MTQSDREGGRRVLDGGPRFSGEEGGWWRWGPSPR